MFHLYTIIFKGEQHKKLQDQKGRAYEKGQSVTCISLRPGSGRDWL